MLFDKVEQAPVGTAVAATGDIHEPWPIISRTATLQRAGWSQDGSLLLVSDAGRMTVGPGRFDQHAPRPAVAGLGDAAERATARGWNGHRRALHSRLRTPYLGRRGGRLARNDGG